jgi:hypothetical protein
LILPRDTIAARFENEVGRQLVVHRVEPVKKVLGQSALNIIALADVNPLVRPKDSIHAFGVRSHQDSGAIECDSSVHCERHVHLFFFTFFGFCFRVDGSPAGGGGVCSKARTASSKLPVIGGTVVSRFTRLGMLLLYFFRVAIERRLADDLPPSLGGWWNDRLPGPNANGTTMGGIDILAVLSDTN